MRLFLSIAGIICTVILVALFYLGAFHKIIFNDAVVDSMVFIYEDYVGPFQNVGKIQMNIYNKLLKEDDIKTSKGLGIYLDDPEKVEAAKLRSQVGCVLNPQDYKKINALKQKYKVKTLDNFNATVVEFPYKNVMSIIVGVSKVYPAFTKFAADNPDKFKAIPYIMEIYDLPNHIIKYVFPFNTVNEF